MKKIIQVLVDHIGNLYALTEEGRLYYRDKKEFRGGKIRTITNYWKEILEEEHFEQEIYPLNYERKPYSKKF